MVTSLRVFLFVIFSIEPIEMQVDSLQWVNRCFNFYNHQLHLIYDPPKDRAFFFNVTIITMALILVSIFKYHCLIVCYDKRIVVKTQRTNFLTFKINLRNAWHQLWFSNSYVGMFVNNWAMLSMQICKVTWEVSFFLQKNKKKKGCFVLLVYNNLCFVDGPRDLGNML